MKKVGGRGRDNVEIINTVTFWGVGTEEGITEGKEGQVEQEGQDQEVGL